MHISLSKEFIKMDNSGVIVVAIFLVVLYVYIVFMHIYFNNRLPFTMQIDKSNVMKPNSKITMDKDYEPQNDEDVVTKKFVMAAMIPGETFSTDGVDGATSSLLKVNLEQNLVKDSNIVMGNRHLQYVQLEKFSINLTGYPDQECAKLKEFTMFGRETSEYGIHFEDETSLIIKDNANKPYFMEIKAVGKLKAKLSIEPVIVDNSIRIQQIATVDDNTQHLIVESLHGGDIKLQLKFFDAIADQQLFTIMINECSYTKKHIQDTKKRLRFKH